MGAMAAMSGLLLAAPPPAAAPAVSASRLISTAALRSDVTFLASDDLAGRSAGSPGDQVATDFIAARFERLGLQPAGDHGTYFQNMALDYASLDPAHTSLTATVAGVQHSFTLNKDFRWSRQSDRPTQVCGPVAFAGYGVDAPEFNYNDFAEQDFTGKIALVLNREPQANDPHSRFMGQWDTYHAFNWGKLEEVRKHGVAGILLVQGGPSRGTKPIPPSAPRASGGPLIALKGEMWDVPIFTLTRAAADQLLAPSGKTTDQLQAQIDASGNPASFVVPNSTACMSKAFTDASTHDDRNVVALLPGSDPTLSAQTVIVTAHHDHMGTVNGHIYHGADDNASGTAAVMEIATAFVQGHVHPRRSVLFMVYAAEERGLVGSYYYVSHPLRPLATTVATLNMDMIGRNENDANWPTPADGNVNMVNVLGTRYNPALGAIVARENQFEGLKLDHKMDAVDPDSLWSRSDQYWYAGLHIPQVLFQTGLQPDYHTENDIAATLNYAKMTKIVRLVFLSAAAVADSSQKIVFYPAGAPPAAPARH